jgi:oleate hydratase
MSTSGKLYLIGGGIASLAAAAYAIRSGVKGEDIHILEQEETLGGSLDGSGDSHSGYMIRGGRMFEAHFRCTYDLFSQIPAPANPGKSVTEDIEEFTRQTVTSSKCRLVVEGIQQEAPAFGLSNRQRWLLVLLTLKSEHSLSNLAINDYFDDTFFTTPFWIMWCTMFAFQPWHSLAEMRRYMRRFMHLLPGFNRLEGIWRTRFNQYDALIKPLVDWLVDRDVAISTNTRVVDIDFQRSDKGIRVAALHLENTEADKHLPISIDDRIMITLGSMTANSKIGSNDRAAHTRYEPDAGAWELWKRISNEDEEFGRPEVFCGNIDLSTWNSFTATSDDPKFFEWMEDFTKNQPGSGGLVTLADSSWLMSVVLAYQPHFANQPAQTKVFWGYGLRPHSKGDFVFKRMVDCTGAEILTELCNHLRIDDIDRVLENTRCLPCAMPYITSQFMPRRRGDRPAVKPSRATNFAFLGQFTELEDDTVFTVEYSVRSAQVAVQSLYQTGPLARPVYRGYLNPLVVTKALWTLAVN